MIKSHRDFLARSAVERRCIVQNTWCEACGEADVGTESPREYEENGRIYVEGICGRCGRTVRSEVIEKDASQ
jgi:hypothetical protein